MRHSPRLRFPSHMIVGLYIITDLSHRHFKLVQEIITYGCIVLQFFVSLAARPGRALVIPVVTSLLLSIAMLPSDTRKRE